MKSECVAYQAAAFFALRSSNSSIFLSGSGERRRRRGGISKTNGQMELCFHLEPGEKCRIKVIDE